jgi:mycothiol synthase
MDLQLPPGYSARPPRADDLQAVVDLVAAADIAHIGERDIDPDDIRNDWEADDFEPEHDARVVVGPDGGLAVYAFSRGQHAFVTVHPDHFGRGLGTALMPFVEARTAPRNDGLVLQQVDGGNDAARELLGAHGYAVAQRYWRMRIDLGADGSTPAPVWPEGIRPRTFVAGADDPATHALVNETFVEVGGFVARELEEWRADATGRLQFRPDASWVAERDGRMVGVATCEVWEAEGYVGYLAVARDQRGLGLGRALLLASFQSLRAAGLARAALGVNASNETGKRLYESVGMQVVWRAERWEKRL